ncbi:MAG: hypothetical protein PHN42_03960 [Bacilli bacterium]|nr:hypothetical protein [Bacilli bacterium]
MKESIGNAFIMGIVITFIIIFMIFFASSLAYTKAFKAKNKIVEIIEKYDDILSQSASENSVLINAVEAEINETLSGMGYRISPTSNNCPSRNNVSAVRKQETANYEYCVYKYTTTKGNYYGVTAYMYFEIPIIGVGLRFPVYGETKISGILG